MVKEAVMKCSQCGHGHNLKACIHANNHHHGNKGSLKLFGVKILMEKEFEAIKKSLSIGNLNWSASSSSLVIEKQHADGYLSDGPVHNARRKGQPWTETEHQRFLKGLEKLGRGDWKGIANKYVMTRSAAQVASHAQKHFLRMTTSHHKKKRPSVFDAPLLIKDNNNINMVREQRITATPILISIPPPPPPVAAQHQSYAFLQQTQANSDHQAAVDPAHFERESASPDALELRLAPAPASGAIKVT